jgi:hypothetical protein
MDFLDLFSNAKSGGLGPRHVDRATRLGSIIYRGGADKRVRRCIVGAQRMGARAHRCSLAVVEEDEAVSEGCSSEHERRRRGGAMEPKNGGGLSSMRERRKARRSSGERGKRGGEGRGLLLPFIGAEGPPGRGGRGGNSGVNGFNAIEDRARLRGVKEGPWWRSELRREGGHSRCGAGWHGEAGCSGIGWWHSQGRLAWGGRES